MRVEPLLHAYQLTVDEDEASILVEALSALKSVDDDLLKRNVPDEFDRLPLIEERKTALRMRDALTAVRDLVREVDSIESDYL